MRGVLISSAGLVLAVTALHSGAVAAQGPGGSSSIAAGLPIPPRGGMNVYGPPEEGAEIFNINELE